MQKRAWLKNFGIVTILSVGVAFGLNVLLLSLNLAQYSERYQETSQLLYSVSLTEQILYSGIAMPILEELLFRGLLFRLLRKWLKLPWAMMLSALAFGLYHGNLVQFIYATICGFVFAYLYEKYHSFIAPIWSHMVMNLVSILLTSAGVFAWITNF